MRLETREAYEIAYRAVRDTGASEAIASSLASAVVSAEWADNSVVGFAHLTDYLDGFMLGRISRDAEPMISSPASAVFCVNANGGIAQLGFDRAYDELVDRAGTLGVAIFSQTNSFTVGELGYYTRRLAEGGLVALAMTNANAQMTTLECRKAVYGTNPISFAAPTNHPKPFVIDQASSAAAFVNVRKAAEHGEAIPAGWAVDVNGASTTDASEAVKGLLLASGGSRGANIALMIEFFAAGLTGANWSMDAPSFATGSECPSVGLFVVAIKPELLTPNFSDRLSTQITRLREVGVRVPGSQFGVTELEVPDELIDRIRSFAKPR